MAQAEADAVHGEDAVGDGRGGTQGDQAVHVRAQVPQGLKAHRKKLPVHIDDGQKQQKLRQGKGQGILVPVKILMHKARYRQPEPFIIHMIHGHVHQRQQEADGNPQPPLHGPGLFFGLFLNTVPAALGVPCARSPTAGPHGSLPGQAVSFCLRQAAGAAFPAAARCLSATGSRESALWAILSSCGCS